jgi:glycerophosphoryl diester phosphodiesterase
MISGHRGTRVHAIENTRAAFDYCMKNNFDYIEFDVKKTRDGRIVVFHDEKIDGLLDGTGRLEDFSLEELRRLRYRDGQTIQTLEELFEQIKKKVRPMLEIKSRNISRNVIDIVQRHGFASDEILIQSFDPRDIHECWKIDPQFDYGLCMQQLGKLGPENPPVLSFVMNSSIPPFRAVCASSWARRIRSSICRSWSAGGSK